MENSAKKAGFAIAAMIAGIVVVGIGVDLWDAYNLQQTALTVPMAGVPAEERLKEEIERLKVANELLRWENYELTKQLQAGEKKELEPLKKDLEPLKKEPDALKAEEESSKAESSTLNDEPVAGD
jgi:hypothetical protein